MFPPLCAEVHLNASDFTRACCLDSGHDGDHMETTGQTWEPPGQTLRRLIAKWGRTHRIAWTGRYWRATTHDPRSHWRTEIAPTPEQLEESLLHHHGPPPGPVTETTTHQAERTTRAQRTG